MPSIDPSLEREGARIMTICNACRYCEGYCAVFPAMERRLTFTGEDLVYLANLCHNCGACLPACQYAPPHEFGVNVPRTLAEIRTATYREYAWPRFFAAAFARNERFAGLAIALSVAFFFAATVAFATPEVVFGAHGGRFFEVIGHDAMVELFSVVSLLVVAALLAGFFRFWHETGKERSAATNVRALGAALHDALSLKNLGGGGEGCTYPEERPSQARRRYHHLVFYGFLLCFAATVVAAWYDNVLGWRAPYPLASAPVILGVIGGIALLAGSLGLLSLLARRDAALVDRKATGMDLAFLIALVLTSVTGLLLLVFRETAAMGTLLAIHLGVVLGLFVTLPYGKFVHGVYHFGALVRSALE